MIFFVVQLDNFKDYFLKVIEGAPILISFIKSNHWDPQTITF